MNSYSIVIPTYNEEKNIGKLLRILITQRNALKKLKGCSIEIIVCDGNSEDRTREIALQYADKVIIETKRSAAAERQKGALNASGDIILFIDADSLPAKNWLKNMVACFETAEGADITVAVGLVYPIEKSWIEEYICHDVLIPIEKVSKALGIPLVYGINMAVRKDIFIKVGGFNLRYITGEDTDLVKKMTNYGRLVFLPNAVVYTSIRRIKKMGKLRFLFFHTLNHFRTYFLNRPFQTYKPVR